MFRFEVKVQNFLAVKEANLVSKNNITVIIAPNRAGKTQLMLLLYTIFWSFWKEIKDEKSSLKFLLEKLKNVLLIRSGKDIVSWDSDISKLLVASDYFKLSLSLSGDTIDKSVELEKKGKFKKFLDKSPIYIQGAGLGDYYKGIYSLKKYYPKWKLISEAVSDLITDLFIVADERVEPERKNKILMELFEMLFLAKFFIQNRRIYIQEKGKRYGIERTASGLKSLSWFYLILRYNLLGNFLFVDEPEVSLHPEYIDRLAYFIYKLSQGRKIFIATHSDYLLESFNKLINKYDFKIDVWEGNLKEKGALYTCYEADKNNLIDTSPLTEIYLSILREGFGNE